MNHLRHREEERGLEHFDKGERVGVGGGPVAARRRRGVAVDEREVEKFLKMVIDADCGEELWFKISTIIAGFGEVSGDYVTWNAVFTEWSATAKYKYKFHECQVKYERSDEYVLQEDAKFGGWRELKKLGMAHNKERW